MMSLFQGRGVVSPERKMHPSMKRISKMGAKVLYFFNVAKCFLIYLHLIPLSLSAFVYFAAFCKCSS